MPRRIPSIGYPVAIILAAATLHAASSRATTSGWRFGNWHVVLAPAEDILVLAQSGENIDVEVRTDGGSRIKLRYDAAKCSEDDPGAHDAFSMPRSVWDRFPRQNRLRMLKSQFAGWAAQADFLCPEHRHGVDLRKLVDALAQFDAQLSMIAG